MKNAEIKRKTNETDIYLSLDLCGRGSSVIDTGCGFLDHMLTLFSRHSRTDLTVKCTGDTYVDYHHTVEDIGIALGTALKQALGNKAGITRYGTAVIPMDEALILTAVDISGRAHLTFDADFPTQKTGDFDTELIEEFFLALVRSADITLHVKKLEGKNSHHIAEGIFKSFARSLRTAVSAEKGFEDDIPSTKGVL